ncbi:alpha/beta fold hydrolase [Lapillicoccus sp.]|uniref:alpha/beta hydrolase n=1 Tax=Lapillicoccus sp. TaxID=1909287 RepID=UPI003264C2E1
MASVGTGATVALLLHQTDRIGSCGWWPYANLLAQNGIRAVMLDFCAYGKSTCDTSRPWAGDYVDQVVRSVAQLRAGGATRVTLVGASIGGTVASLAATPAKADAVANVSGFGFGSMMTGPSIAALTVPVLGVGSHSEESDSVNLQSQVAGSASPTKRFVWEESGHGWSLVFDGPFADSPPSAVGRTVMGWVKGDYTI